MQIGKLMTINIVGMALASLYSIIIISLLVKILGNQYINK